MKQYISNPENGYEGVSKPTDIEDMSTTYSCTALCFQLKFPKRLPSDGQILDALDQYEEFDPSNPKRSLFIRKKAKVRMANGSSREGWIYVYNRHPGNAKLVRDGDYLRSKVA